MNDLEFNDILKELLRKLSKNFKKYKVVAEKSSWDEDTNYRIHFNTKSYHCNLVIFSDYCSYYIIPNNKKDVNRSKHNDFCIDSTTRLLCEDLVQMSNSTADKLFIKFVNSL